MNKAKLVMLLYTIAAMTSMLGIGFSFSLIWMAGTDKYDVTGYIGIVACTIAMIAVFGFGMVQKKKFREAGLL